MNGFGAKLASNLDAKVAVFTLADPKQRKTCVCFNFHDFDFTALLRKERVVCHGRSAVHILFYKKHLYKKHEVKLGKSFETFKKLRRAESQTIT